MNYSYLTLVLKDIKSKKFTSFLTLFAISLGILSLFVIISLSSSFESSIAAEFEKLGTNRLYITPASSGFQSTMISGLTDREVSLIESRPFVTRAYPYYTRNVQFKYGNDFKRNLALGVEFSEQHFKDLNLELDIGRIPRENERFSLVLGSDAAEKLFDRRLNIGSNLEVRGVKFRVVGILESYGNAEDDRNIYMNINTLRELFNSTDDVGFIYVMVDDNYDLEIAQENLQILLDNRVGKDKIDIITPTELLDQFNSILGIIKATLGGIAFITLLVGSIGIINTMYVVVTEKTKDIGIIKSIGATNFQVLSMYMFQAGIFGLLGAIFGTFFGALAVLGFGAVAQQSGFGFLQVSIDFLLILYLVIFGFLLGAFAGFLPARQASKLDVVEALRK